MRVFALNFIFDNDEDTCGGNSYFVSLNKINLKKNRSCASHFLALNRRNVGEIYIFVERFHEEMT